MEDAACFVDQGSQLAETAIVDIIKQQTEAYILTIAGQFQGELTAEVFVQEKIPVSVILKGQISPHGKLQLETILEHDLGITKENIVWL